MVSINFDKKKSENFDFFTLFSNKSYFFCEKLNAMRKMLFFEALHVEIAQNNSEKGPNELELMPALGKDDFGAKICSTSRRRPH